ncbi:MAG: DUF177 domain-containing protein [Actinobacteria bacterium]|nr:DUF177 domain-containing protein [Actinomycetota bacterium]
MTTFDLRRLKIRPGEEHRDQEDIELAPFDLGGQRYLPVPETVPSELVINRVSSGTVFELGFRPRLYGPCYRCLNEAVVDLPIHAREYQATNPGESDELRTQYVVDNHLQLSDWARDAIALELPEQILCRPDCAGLCPLCGEDLNDNSHEHVDERPDPRWAALESLKDKL